MLSYGGKILLFFTENTESIEGEDKGGKVDLKFLNLFNKRPFWFPANY